MGDRSEIAGRPLIDVSYGYALSQWKYNLFIGSHYRLGTAILGGDIDFRFPSVQFR